MEGTDSAPECTGGRRTLNRRELLALLGAGVAGGAVLGRGDWLGASAPPGPTIPAPTIPPQLLAPPAVPTVAELAADLQWDIGAMFRFVADEVGSHPYAGALRGAAGTLWAKAGNPVDQAILLGALLDEAVVPWRFAIGATGDDVAVAAADPATVDTARARAAAVLLPPEVADGWTGGPWRRLPEADALLARAAEQVADSIAVVSDALRAAGVEALATGPAPDQPHVWVQYADGPNWIDLDPSGPAAEPGVGPGEPAETVAELPAELFHTVTVRVVAEVVAGGVPERRELVSHTVRSAEVEATPIYVVHAPVGWLDITSVLTGDQQYQATIVVGDEAIEGQTTVLGRGEGALDVLGEESTGADGQTLAEWLEIDVTVPGGAVRTAQRQLFDRIPAERRDADDGTGTALGLDDLPPIELTFIDDEIGSVFLPFAGPYVIAVAGNAVPWNSFSTRSADGAERPATEDELIAQSAYVYEYVRELVALDQLEQLGVVLYDDEPVVASLHAAPRPGAADSAPGTIQLVDTGIDLLHVHHGTLALAERDGPEYPGVTAGAVAHAAERLLVAMAGALLDPTSAPDPTAGAEVSAGRVFELAAEADIAVQVLIPGVDVASADLPGNARRLVDAALAANKAVVIPASTVEIGGEQRIGWWEFDLTTGATIDRMDDGGQAAANEYAFLVRIFTMAACAFAVLGAIAFVAKAAQGKLNTLTDFVDSLSSAGGAVAGCGAGGFAL